MIDFKSIQLTDKKIFDAYIAGNNYRSCDFSFTNLFSWQNRFKTTFAVEQDTLFIRYKDAEGIYCYIFPTGRMPLDRALRRIIEDSEERSVPFLLKGITIQMWNEITLAMPDIFQYKHDRDNDEYIYLSERLIHLKGKKLQSKRNHINRFQKDNPDWSYCTISSLDELGECVEMLNQWEDLNMEKAENSLRFDYIATRNMLDNFETLGLTGGLIRVNGKVVAFTIGEQLTEDTFVIHVEKAFSEMNGAYAIINQQFAEHEASSYTYINREEDMGLEYLRKAKMSYYPDVLLKEHILTLK